MTPTTTRSTSRAMGRVAFVGAGPGDPGLLTLRAVELLAPRTSSCSTSSLREDDVARWTRDDVEFVDAGFGDDGTPLTLAGRAKLVTRAAKGRAVASCGSWTATPATFNGLAEEALACRKAGSRPSRSSPASPRQPRCRPTPACR